MSLRHLLPRLLILVKIAHQTLIYSSEKNYVVFVINIFVNFVLTGLIEVTLEILVLPITTIAAIPTSEYAQFVKE